MFRKIHSNRDPNDTLFKELRKEFSGYFEKAERSFTSLLTRKPRWSFALMVGLLVLSGAFAVFYARTIKKETKKPHVDAVRPIGDGFSQILEASRKLQLTLQIRHLVDSISAKRNLTHRDSLVLDSALDRLQSIQKSIK